MSSDLTNLTYDIWDQVYLSSCSLRRFNHELNSRLIKVNIENGGIPVKKVCYVNKNIKHQHKEMKKKKHIKIHRLIQKTLLQINLYEVTGAPAALNLNKPKRNLKKKSRNEHLNRNASGV